jgi:hypothetical protein
MKLTTKAIEKKLPALYATEGVKAADKIAVIKFFSPVGRATWYAVEGQRVCQMGDLEMFGYCVSALGSDCDEWGYFNLLEFKDAVLPLGLKIERDLYFTPTRMGDLVPGLDTQE